MQERERVIGRVVEGHLEAAGQIDGFCEPGMREPCLLEIELHQCRQPLRSVRRETPCDCSADFVEPQRRQQRAYRFIDDRSAQKQRFVRVRLVIRWQHPFEQDRRIGHHERYRHFQWPCCRSSRIHLVTSSVLTFGSRVRRASISRTASLRRRRATQARKAWLMARLRSPAGTRSRNPQVSLSIITLMRLLMAAGTPGETGQCVYDYTLLRPRANPPRVSPTRNHPIPLSSGRSGNARLITVG